MVLVLVAPSTRPASSFLLRAGTMRRLRAVLVAFLIAGGTAYLAAALLVRSFAMMGASLAYASTMALLSRSLSVGYHAHPRPQRVYRNGVRQWLTAHSPVKVAIFMEFFRPTWVGLNATRIVLCAEQLRLLGYDVSHRHVPASTSPLPLPLELRTACASTAADQRSRFKQRYPSSSATSFMKHGRGRGRERGLHIVNHTLPPDQPASARAWRIAWAARSP